MCNAKIKINGQVYECEHEREDHKGPHITRAYSDRNLIDGFAWDILDSGEVFLCMPPHVARNVFQTWKVDERSGNIPPMEPQGPEDISF